MRIVPTVAFALVCTPAGAAPPPVDLGDVTEEHEMVPMHDGTKLSVYLYFPPGKGPWPVLLEQRYADLTAPGTRKSFARLAEGGCPSMFDWPARTNTLIGFGASAAGAVAWMNAQNGSTRARRQIVITDVQRWEGGRDVDVLRKGRARGPVQD
jgi:predicted acyl esterase